MLNIVPTTNVPCHNYYLPYNTKTCITMWKLEITTKDNFVYVSLLNHSKETVTLNSSLSVFLPLRSVIYVTNIQFRTNCMI